MLAREVSGTVDPETLLDLNIPELQEKEECELPVDTGHLSQEEVEASRPGRRLRKKSTVKFVDLEAQDVEGPETVSERFLLDDDYSDGAFRAVMSALQEHEKASLDRRGNFESRFIFGAYSHGGNRGIVKMSKRLPKTTRFFNNMLRKRLPEDESEGECFWSAIMVMKAVEIDTHKDVRNEWGSKNYVMCIPGTFELCTQSDSASPGKYVLTGKAVGFDARIPHSVKRNPDWFIVGYSPLGTCKMPEDTRSHLLTLGFRHPAPALCSTCVKMVYPDEDELSSPPSEEAEDGDAAEDSQRVLESDVQPDSVTQLIGWDFSRGDPGEYPALNLEETDLHQFLAERGVSWLFRRLRSFGIEETDLQFIFVEDLLEYGISLHDAQRIMQGVHPANTLRADNPELCAMRTGEVRMLDRDQRLIPWVIQNRSLMGEELPLEALGVRTSEPHLDHDDRDWVDYLERGGQHTQASGSIDVPVCLGAQGPSGSADVPVCLGAQGPSGSADVPVCLGAQGPSGSADVPVCLGAQGPSSSADVPVCLGAQGPSGSTDVPVCLGAQGPSGSADVPVCLGAQGPSGSADVPVCSGAQGSSSSVYVPYRRQAQCGVDADAEYAQYALHMQDLWDQEEVRDNGNEDSVSPKGYECKMVSSSEALDVDSVSLERDREQPSIDTGRRASRIGVPLGSPLSVIDGIESGDHDFPWLNKVDDSFYTKDVEDLLKGLMGPLKVVHNVSPEEVRRNLDVWRPSAFLAFITDIKNAFLLAPLPKKMQSKILLKPPKVLELLNITDPSEYWLVCKAVYGLRQSPKWWSDYRDSILREAQWNGARGRVTLIQSEVEPNLWKMVCDNKEVVGFIIVYVDDIMYLTSREEIVFAYEWLKKTWTCTPLEEATQESPVTFLGVEVHLGHDSQGSYGFQLGQRGYIDELMRAHQICPRHQTPLPKEWVRELPPVEDGYSDDALRQAQRVTGELLWLTQRTRVDVAFIVSLMGSWTTRSPGYVVKMGQRLLDYLGTTRDFRLSLVPVEDEKKIVVFTDASFSPFGDHSISGILVTYLGRAVVWKAKKQTLISLSTAEAELISACEGVVLAQSTEAMLQDVVPITASKLPYVDNLAAIALSEGAGSQRTRHLRVRSNFMKEMIINGELTVEHVPGEYRLADLLTKVLPGPRHHALAWQIGLGGDPPVHVAAVTQVPGLVNQIDLNNTKLAMLVLIMVMHFAETEAADEEEASGEPVSLELSVVAVMMMLSVLFVWESGKFCISRCCRDERPAVRALSAEHEEPEGRLRRRRRQEAIRRAIDQEAEIHEIRRRQPSEVDVPDPVASGSPVIQVNIEGSSQRVSTSPPIPRFNTSAPGFAEQETFGRQDQATSSAYPPAEPSVLSTSTPSFPERSRTSARVNVTEPAKREVSVQTDFPRGLTHEEMRTLQLTTTNSRTPGVVHLFPDCHALRGVSSVNRRSFCRYCVNAAARTGL